MGNNTNTNTNEKFKSKIGGQALVEGIMMLGPTTGAMACRLPDGTIDLETWAERNGKNAPWYKKVPLVRGCTSFITSLTKGYKYMMKSAEKQLTEEEMMRVAQDWASANKDAYKDVDEAYADVVKHMDDGSLTVEQALVLTGRTSYEASQTVEGSMNSAKAAWENWLISLSDPKKSGTSRKPLTRLRPGVKLAIKAVAPLPVPS
jgi:hypothetical protein